MVTTRSRGKRKAAAESSSEGAKHERNGVSVVAKKEDSVYPKSMSSDLNKEIDFVVPVTALRSSSLDAASSKQSKILLQKSAADDDEKHQVSMKTEEEPDIKGIATKSVQQDKKTGAQNPVVPVNVGSLLGMKKCQESSDDDVKNVPMEDSEEDTSSGGMPMAVISKDKVDSVVPEKACSLSAASNNNRNNAICDSSSDDDNEKKVPSPKRKPTNDPIGRAQPSKKKPTFDSSSSSSDDEDKRSTIKINTRKKKISELSDEDSDVDEEDLERTMKRFLSNNKRSALDSSDDDSSDSSIDVVVVRRSTSPRKKKKVASSAAETKAMKQMDITTVEPLPLLSDNEKEAALQNIDNEADKNLQRLLWSLGIRYTLLSYQFTGVRALTGVNDNFPTIIPRQNYTSKDWKRVLRDTQMADQYNNNDDNDNNKKKHHRGVLMADVMGLGKTVQAVVACMLRNSIASAQDLACKPTILVSPNHAVTTQWAETLIKAGVPSSNVREFVPKKGTGLAQLWHKNSDIYLLLNRYQLQTETRHLFAEIPNEFRRNSRTVNEYKSPLFPIARRQLICILKNQYESAQGKAKNEHREDGETPAACVTRLLSRCMRNDKAFRTLVIDEAHFLKNLLSYWGLGASLLGLQVERVIPMSGTPYNNSAQDIATLMTFVDPTLHSAYESWWKSATAKGAPQAVADTVKEWNESYMIRREKKVLGEKLKRKHVVSKDVPPIPLELHVYEKYESAFLRMLEKFSGLTDDYSPIAMARKKELYKSMISMAALARMSLIHPVIPSGGREYTINFSPTRRHLSRNLCNTKRCVCCKYRQEENLTKKGKRKGSSARRDDNLENLGDDELMGDDESYMDDDYHLDVDKGEIVEVPVEYCTLPCIREGGLRHHVHEDCLDGMGDKCPLCADLQSRALMNSAKESLMSKIEDAVPMTDVKPDSLGSIADLQCLNMNARSLYCGDAVEGLEGFRGSAKIESIMSDFKKIPHGEKVLLLSFFKSSLDLIEGILHYELGINYARFDGDLVAEERQKELDRFKSEADCKVLLMTVQTGGTGLNIVEACRVIFVDRWFNPFVHEQAEDRCYRLGQQRDVHVKYYDVSYTIDNCMRVLNEVKVTNASIVLADGQTTLSMTSSGLSYKEMNGLLGNSVRAARSARIENVLGRSLSGMESAMVPPPNFADRLVAGEDLVDKHGYMLQRPRSAFATIADALLHMLGYTRAPNPTSAAATRTMQPKSEKSSTYSENSDSEKSSSSEEEEEDRKQPAILRPGTKAEIVSSQDIHRKVSVESTKSSSLLDFSSDDDSLSSIPGPAFAKKSKP